MYGADLAAVHHVGFSALARGAAPWVIHRLREEGILKGVVVELGCGSGILAEQLCQAGYDVVGVDVSRRMLEIARSVAPGALFVLGTLHEMELPPSAAVLAIGEGIQYIPEGSAVVDPRKLFERVSRSLRPGGLFIFDVMVKGEDPVAYERSSYGPGWVVRVRVTEEPLTGVVTRAIATRRKAGCRYRDGAEVHRVQLLEERQTIDQLEALGFDVEVSSGYGVHALAPGRRAFIARKRSAG